MPICTLLINSVMLGVGLAMDAFSVSIANGLNDPTMKENTKFKIAGMFAGFQCIMPLLGWMFVRYLVETFSQFQKWIPWIALLLLLYIGGKMIIEAFTGDDSEDDNNINDEKLNVTNDNASDFDVEEKDVKNNSEKLSNQELIIQGIATSIDALSVGFTIADYKLAIAFICAVIIAVVTFIICEMGLKIGIKFGMKLAKKASVFGGLILIFIGIEIFVKGVFM